VNSTYAGEKICCFFRESKHNFPDIQSVACSLHWQSYDWINCLETNRFRRVCKTITWSDKWLYHFRQSAWRKRYLPNRFSWNFI